MSLNIFLCVILMIAVAVQFAATLLLWARQTHTRKALRQYRADAHSSGVEEDFWKILYINSHARWGESYSDIERRWDANMIQGAYAKALESKHCSE